MKNKRIKKKGHEYGAERSRRKLKQARRNTINTKGEVNEKHTHELFFDALCSTKCLKFREFCMQTLFLQQKSSCNPSSIYLCRLYSVHLKHTLFFYDCTCFFILAKSSLNAFIQLATSYFKTPMSIHQEFLSI